MFQIEIWLKRVIGVGEISAADRLSDSGVNYK